MPATNIRLIVRSIGKLKFIILPAIAFLASGLVSQVTLEDALDRYWQSGSAVSKQRAIKQILALDPSFEDVFALLKKGRKYTPAKAGFIKVQQRDPKLPPHALVVIPETYTPDKKYPLQVYLHGAVSNMDPDILYRYTVDTLSNQLLQSKSIMLFPTAWYLAPWWSESQYNNLNYLVDWVKENYNIDENRIRLSGVSDGGIGSYYFANCNQTVWSSVTPFIGSIRALNKIGDRQLYLNNFKNTSLLIVNTGKDHIFDLSMEKPYVQGLQEINSGISFIEVDSSGHSLGWYPVLRDSINSFVDKNPREPFPDHLYWQTDRVDKYGRLKYLVIEKLGRSKIFGDVVDHNKVTLSGRDTQAFGRSMPSGIIELHKEGNVVNVKTSGIKRYKLLISPNHFDFQKPIVIYTNDVKSFEEQLTPDVKTLLKWNAEDNDREMLFGAELTITVN